MEIKIEWRESENNPFFNYGFINRVKKFRIIENKDGFHAYKYSVGNYGFLGLSESLETAKNVCEISI